MGRGGGTLQRAAGDAGTARRPRQAFCPEAWDAQRGPSLGRPAGRLPHAGREESAMLACCPGGLRDLKSGAPAVNGTEAKSPRRPGLRRRGFSIEGVI